MLYCIPDSEIERFIEEDVPYGDLTTFLLGIGNKTGRIVFMTREETTVCCTEEAKRVLERCGAYMVSMQASGSHVQAGVEILVAEGTAQSLHTGWKVALNLLEYASGIATRTRRIVKAAQGVNPRINVVTTRKSFPGTKKIVIKAVCAGGAQPHRLGLSETVLVFKQHTAFMGGLDGFLQSISDIKLRTPETKIMVEAESAAEAVKVAHAGVDVIQVDKVVPSDLSPLVQAVRAIDKKVKLSAAGGINVGNVSEYAASGVDILVLSSVYFGKPADIGAKMIKI